MKSINHFSREFDLRVNRLKRKYGWKYWFIPLIALFFTLSLTISLFGLPDKNLFLIVLRVTFGVILYLLLIWKSYEVLGKKQVLHEKLGRF